MYGVDGVEFGSGWVSSRAERTVGERRMGRVDEGCELHKNLMFGAEVDFIDCHTAGKKITLTLHPPLSASRADHRNVVQAGSVWGNHAAYSEMPG
jgi:hypothetical protein